MDNAIEARQLRKRYGSQLVLDGISFAVPSGSVFCLLGPNGAGKTTTVRILATLSASDGGSASVAGFDVASQRSEVRRRISLTGQYAALDELQTGSENLRMMGRLRGLSRPASRRRATELLDRFDLAEVSERRVATYSGGLRRRLDLAAGLVGRPEVIFLDEPTTGLDPRSRQGMWDVVTELVADGVSVLLTTQYLEEADRLADRIAVVDHGRIAAEGTATELKRAVGGSRLELTFFERTELTRVATALGGAALSVDPAAGSPGSGLRARGRRRPPASRSTRPHPHRHRAVRAAQRQPGRRFPRPHPHRIRPRHQGADRCLS